MEPRRPVVVEICAGNIDSVQAAAEAQAHRIELCTDLASGGTTPSHGLIATAARLLDNYRLRPVLMVLIRPRPGSFIYSSLELQIMCADIRASRSLGADGVVFGCLREDQPGKRTVDTKVVDSLLQVVEEEHWTGEKPGNVTFHRAFDDCHDLDKAIEDICLFQGRIQRVLTSGGRATALQGITKLKALCAKVKLSPHQSPSIMAGAGITAENVSDLVTLTGVSEIHSSAKGEAMGSHSVGDLFRTDNLVSTDLLKVEAILVQLSQIAQPE